MNEPANPRVYVAKTSWRDRLIAYGVAATLLVVVIFGVVALRKHHRSPSRNQLTGVIVEKYHTGEREKEITFGRKGLKGLETDAGYRFQVRVESEKRNFELPVEKELYESKKVGDPQSFIRPPSEQR